MMQNFCIMSIPCRAFLQALNHDKNLKKNTALRFNTINIELNDKKSTDYEPEGLVF